MEAGFETIPARGHNGVQLQDRGYAYRDRRSEIAGDCRMARTPDQDPSLRPAAGYDRGGLQGRRYRKGRCGMAARDDAAWAERQGYRTGPGGPVLRGLFQP